jgi:hypothetical protein
MNFFYERNSKLIQEFHVGTKQLSSQNSSAKTAVGKT